MIIDFAAYAPGTKIYFVNVMEHKTGIRPNDMVPLATVLQGFYACDTAVGKFLEFRVKPYAGVDRSMDPRQYVPGNPGDKTMIAPPVHDLTDAKHVTFSFGKGAKNTHNPTGMAAGMPIRMSVPSEQFNMSHQVNNVHPINELEYEDFKRSLIAQGGKPPGQLCVARVCLSCSRFPTS